MSANFTPDMTGYKGLSPFRFWCQKTLPLVYDDSLSYYELLCKVVSYINNLITDVAAAEENVDKLLTAYNQLQEYVNNYFDGEDFQQKIDDSLDRYAEDGTLSRMVNTHVSALLPYEVGRQIGPVVDEDLGPVVDLKLPAVVESKIAAPVATQLPDVVQTQIGGVVGNQIGDVVADQINEVVADQITDAVSPLVHDEVTGLIRPAVATELPAALQVYLPPEVQTQLPGAIGTDLETIAPPVIEDWLDAHPEATTSVPDGSISFSKLATDLQRRAGIVGTYFPSDFTNEFAWQVNQYAVYQGIVYRCIKTTTAGQAWNASEWTTANMNSDLFYMWWCLNYLSQSITTIDSSPATTAHEAGEYFIYYDGAHLYRLAKASSNIAVGDTLTPNGNFIYSSVANMIAELKVEIADLKSAFDGFIEGETLPVDVLTESVLQNGNFNVNDDISTPTASNYRKAYTVGFELTNDSLFVANTDGQYNICFCAFDSNGVCISTPIAWLTDGTYTASEIMANARSTVGAKYSFQIKKIDGSIMTGETVNVLRYYHLYEQMKYQIGTESIEDNAVTKNKLSHELQVIIDNILPSPTTENKLSDVLLVSGAFAVNDNISTPTASNYRKAYNVGFELSDDMVFAADTNGVYEISFCAFDSSGVCISTPTSWLTDGVYTASEVMANARSTVAAKYSFQIKRVDGASMASETVETLDYYSLTSAGTIDTVDVIMFMGQSNMAGRGEVANAPALIPGAGYEYRAISAPNVLSPMVEPFGVTENNPNGINEGSSKTGSMVVAFTNAYYTHNGGIPVIGISASKGGTPISDWQPEGAYLTDAIARLSSCVEYLSSKGYTIRHKYILWCQGETDGDNGTTPEQYKSLFGTMLSAMKVQGIEKLFMVRIGNYNSGASTKYDAIMNVQTEIAQTNDDVVMVSTDFAGMRARGLMKDAFHYYQAAYNEVGTYAGINTAIFEQTGKEPTMYDTKDGTLYYSHKN